jgi:hypothetical protein
VDVEQGSRGGRGLGVLNQSRGRDWVLNRSDERRLLNWFLRRLFFDLVSQVTGCFEMLQVDGPELVPPRIHAFSIGLLPSVL